MNRVTANHVYSFTVEAMKYKSFESFQDWALHKCLWDMCMKWEDEYFQFVIEHAWEDSRLGLEMNHPNHQDIMLEHMMNMNNGGLSPMESLKWILPYTYTDPRNIRDVELLMKKYKVTQEQIDKWKQEDDEKIKLFYL